MSHSDAVTRCAARDWTRAGVTRLFLGRAGQPYSRENARSALRDVGAGAQPQLPTRTRAASASTSLSLKIVSETADPRQRAHRTARGNAHKSRRSRNVDPDARVVAQSPTVSAEGRRARPQTRRPRPKPRPNPNRPPSPKTSDRREKRVAVKAWRAQKSLLGKLRNLSEDARTYEQDTGVHALNLGYPILSLPPGAMGGTRRILAPLAFIPLTLEVNAGRRPHAYAFAAMARASTSLRRTPRYIAWIERETGRVGRRAVRGRRGRGAVAGDRRHPRTRYAGRLELDDESAWPP